MNVKIVKMTSGEELIGDYDEKKNITNNIDTNYGFMNNTKFYVINFNNQKITFTPPKKSIDVFSRLSNDSKFFALKSTPAITLDE